MGLFGRASAFGDKDLIKGIDIEKTKEMIEKSQTPYISAHICTKNVNQTKEETLEAIKENIKVFKDVFEKDVVLENIPYRSHYSHCEYAIDPEFISQVVHENNINFLFDISHARSAANHLGMTLEEYASKLPMDKVIEFHLAGMYDIPDISKEEIKNKYTDEQIRFINTVKSKCDKRADDHGKMNEEDYKFLEESLPKYKDTLKYITLEYGSYSKYEGFEDSAYTYPVADFKSSKQNVKEEVFEQLERIHKIISSGNF